MVPIGEFTKLQKELTATKEALQGHAQQHNFIQRELRKAKDGEFRAQKELKKAQGTS